MNNDHANMYLQSYLHEFKPLLNVIAPRKTHGQDCGFMILEGCATARHGGMTF